MQRDFIRAHAAQMLQEQQYGYRAIALVGLSDAAQELCRNDVRRANFLTDRLTRTIELHNEHQGYEHRAQARNDQVDVSTQFQCMSVISASSPTVCFPLRAGLRGRF